MASSVEVKLNIRGVRALRRSSEVQADLRRRAERIAAAAGSPDDYEVVESVTSRTELARARVITWTAKARRDEATNHTLTRALDAGR